MFLQRLHRFEPDNPYYVKGGKFNIYSENVQMPNCTIYSYLRMEEMCELDKMNNYLVREEGGFGNAKEWYDTTPLPKGRQYHEGGILVFSGTYGHVCACEQINDYSLIVTQSQYDEDKSLRNYKYWECREVELINGIPHLDGVGDYIGCIYPPIKDIRTIRDVKCEQVEITQDYVNVRKTPEGELVNVGCYAPKGIYNVLDKQIVNGYTWFKLEENHFVREGEWTIHYPCDDSDYKSLYELEVKKNNELKERLNKIKELADYE